jgi:hypothetical protein
MIFQQNANNSTTSAGQPIHDPNQQPKPPNGIDSNSKQRRKNSFTPPMPDSSTLSFPPNQSAIIPMLAAYGGISEFGPQEHHQHHFMGHYPADVARPSNADLGMRRISESAIGRYPSNAQSISLYDTVSSGSSSGRKALHFLKVLL